MPPTVFATSVAHASVRGGSQTLPVSPAIAKIASFQWRRAAPSKNTSPSLPNLSGASVKIHAKASRKPFRHGCPDKKGNGSTTLKESRRKAVIFHFRETTSIDTRQGPSAGENLGSRLCFGHRGWKVNDDRFFQSQPAFQQMRHNVAPNLGPTCQKRNEPKLETSS